MDIYYHPQHYPFVPFTCCFIITTCHLYSPETYYPIPIDHSSSLYETTHTRDIVPVMTSDSTQYCLFYHIIITLTLLFY